MQQCLCAAMSMYVLTAVIASVSDMSSINLWCVEGACGRASAEPINMSTAFFIECKYRNATIKLSVEITLKAKKQLCKNV